MTADEWGWEVTDPDIIARATASDGREVLLLTAPAAALDGSDGPVVIPGFDSDRVHVVLSDEFIGRYVIADEDTAETVREKLALLSYAVRESLSIGIDALDGRL